MRALVSIENHFLRTYIQDMISDFGMHMMLATDINHAFELLRLRQHRINLFACDLKPENARAKIESWRMAQERTKKEGYFITQKCFVLVNNKSYQLASGFGKRNVIVINTEETSDIDRISNFIEKLRASPILSFTHVGASRQNLNCMPGEKIAPITFRASFDAESKALHLRRFVRIVADAVAKYCSKGQPHDNQSLIELMSVDPFYRHLAGDRSCTPRNYINGWCVFKNELHTVGGNLAACIAVSDRVGREAYHYIDAECNLDHKETHL